LTAEELVTRLRANGARVHRTVEPPGVFVLTSDPILVGWLTQSGARLRGSYDRNPWGAAHLGEELIAEYDFWINPMAVEGDVWEAAAA
jgi:hypothetical protein